MTTGRVPITSPFYLAKRGLRTGIARYAPLLEGDLLDVGCGEQPYRPLFSNALYVGLEVNRDSPLGSLRSPDVYYDGKHIPMPDGAVDSILCSQVLEHVFEPSDFLAELHRVLRPGGRILITVPFVWDEHEQPYDFARYSSFGLRHLFERAGFAQVAHHRTLGDGSIFLQLWLASTYKALLSWPRLPRLALLAALSVPANVSGLLIQALSRGHGDLYLDNVAVFQRSDASADPARSCE